MINQESMSVVESLFISGVGMLAVFVVLAVLAIAIKLLTGALSFFEKKQPVNNVAMTVANSGADDENHAVVLAVMNEELNSKDQKYRVTSVKERGGK
ncbi:MAG: OadG family protein [Lachnospiraceae bacterium]